MGKSLESYIKNENLKYIECFESQFCSELPLVEAPPPTFVPPPSLVKKVHLRDLTSNSEIFDQSDLAVVDSVGYIDDNPELCFWLYEQAVGKGCRLILGGCSSEEDVTEALREEAELMIKLENDVGGFGKLKVISGDMTESVLWKNVKGKVEFSRQIVI